MIRIFVSNLVPLKHRASLVFALGMTLRKLGTFEAAYLEDSAKVSLLPLLPNFLLNVLEFPNLALNPTDLVQKLLPLLVHCFLSLRNLCNIILIYDLGNKRI